MFWTAETIKSGIELDHERQQFVARLTPFLAASLEKIGLLHRWNRVIILAGKMTFRLNKPCLSRWIRIYKLVTHPAVPTGLISL